MNLLPHLTRSVRLAAAFGVVGVLTVGLPIAQASQAQAATVAWVDGGDDQPCLQDDMGAALTSLAEDKFCQPIPTCHEYDGNNPKYKGRIVQSSASTGIWQGNPGDVLYEDDLPSDYNLTTPTPTKSPSPTKAPTPVKTPKPTKAPTPTKTPTGTTTKAPTQGLTIPTDTKTTGTTPTKTTTTTPTTPTDDLGIDPDEKAVEGAPTAPGTPTLTVDGSSIVVTWEPSADVDLDSVTGYVVQLSGDNRAEVDADTTTYTFTDLPDGSYRAAVRAVNTVGESAASTPSEPVTLGTPVESVVGTLTWTGDVTPGATVTLAGAGYAANAALDIELHSDPVLLTTVTTDAAGAFSTDVVVPADAPEGAHNFVVAYQGTVISQSPVTVAAAAPVAPVTADKPVAATEPAETVPPITGLIILAALAAAGVLLLVTHYARGGSRRKASSAPAVATPAVAASPAATAVLPPLQLSTPTIPAFLAGSSIASPARPASGALRAPETSSAR